MLYSGFPRAVSFTHGGVNTVLLTVVTMLYIASLGLNLFLITESLYLLTPFTTSPPSQPPPLVTTSLFSVSQFGYLVLFLSNSVHK